VITPDKFKEVVSHFATGVTIVTGTYEDGDFGFTCQTFLSVSLDPPLIAIAPSKSSKSWPHIQKSGLFAVNVLATDQAELANSFARSVPDKFNGVKFTRGITKSPLVLGCLGYIEAEITKQFEVGDHFIVIGKVVDLFRQEGEPLLYFKTKFGKFI
jgi:flavin reductase (DIM6/NTAB) family NADH-FMN oxidoreductase RutF